MQGPTSPCVQLLMWKKLIMNTMTSLNLKYENWFVPFLLFNRPRHEWWDFFSFTNHSGQTQSEASTVWFHLMPLKQTAVWELRSSWSVMYLRLKMNEFFCENVESSTLHLHTAAWLHLQSEPARIHLHVNKHILAHGITQGIHLFLFPRPMGGGSGGGGGGGTHWPHSFIWSHRFMGPFRKGAAEKDWIQLGEDDWKQATKINIFKMTACHF